MTGDGDLERRYRWLLRWYPASFRAEYESEIIGVLLAGASAGQRRPTLADCLDVIVNGLRMRLRPSSAHVERSTRPAVRALYLGAIVEFVAAITLIATMGDVATGLVGRDAGDPDARWRAVVAGQVEPVAAAAGIAVVAWLVLAWGIGRGQRWARIAFAILFGLNVTSLVHGLAQGSASYAPADAAIGTLLCLVQLVAVCLVFRPAPGTVTRLRSVAGRSLGRRP